MEVLISPEELDTQSLDVANARAAFKGKLLYSSGQTGVGGEGVCS